MMKEKIGLLVEGGGMKCAYSAGVLDILLDENIQFDYCMGISAGAANIASFLGAQRDRNRRFYCVHVKDPKYISIGNFLKTGNLFGLQYIYGNMTNSDGIDPLDFTSMTSNPAELVFPATNASSGEVKYFTKSDLAEDRYEPIMATCAIPVMCQPIQIGDEYYYDGGVGASLPIDKMLADGCTRVLALLSKPRGYHMQPQSHRFSYTLALKRKFPKTVEALNHRHENYNSSLEKLLALEKEGRAFLFCPSSDIKMGTYTTDPNVMQRLYDNGVADALSQMENLKHFLKC